MSSMWRVAAIFPVMLAMTPGSSSAQYASPTYVSAPAYAPTVASSISRTTSSAACELE